jgi:hypothetical protein
VTDYGSSRERGFALTLEPRIATSIISASGAFRFITPQFHAPAGSSFFSSLRRSYNLTVAARPSARMNVDVSSGQAKTFSLFDPEDVGTLSSSRSISAGYGMTDHLSSFINYGESDIKTEAGALIRADSHTTRYGFGSAYHLPRVSTSMQVSKEAITNELDRSLDFEATRFDFDQTYHARDRLEIFDRAHYEDARRLEGPAAGSGYGAMTGVRYYRPGRGNLSAQVGFSEAPAGVALQRVRQSFASLSVAGSGSSFLQASMSLTFQRVEVGNSTPQDAWLLSFGGGHLLRWGSGLPPIPPSESRAMRLTDTVISTRERLPLTVFVYEDVDRDGRLSPSDRGISEVPLLIDSERAFTSHGGEVTLSVNAGSHRVSLPPEGPLLEYFVSTPSRSVTAVPGRPEVVAMRVLPAGRIAGRIVFPTARATVLDGVRVTATSADLERSAVSAPDGTFNLGVVPTGDYLLRVDLGTLPEGVALDGQPQISVHVGRGERATPVLRLRRATARERFGIQGGGKPGTE